MYRLVKIAFYGKTMENVTSRIKAEFFRRDDEDKSVEQQSKVTFKGIHKFFTNYDSHTSIKTK